MPNSSQWQYFASAGALAVGVGVGLYYLLREDNASSDSGDSDKDGTSNETKGNSERDSVIETLHDILKTQEETKGTIKDLTNEIEREGYNFRQTYERVIETTASADPLEKHGLTTESFDQKLSKYRNDSDIRELIAHVMNSSPTQQKSNTMTCKQVVEVHKKMLEEVRKHVTEYMALENKDQYDPKSAVIAVQALVGAAVIKEHGHTPEDVEVGIFNHQKLLSEDPEFGKINIEMAHMIGQLFS